MFLKYSLNLDRKSRPLTVSYALLPSRILIAMYSYKLIENYASLAKKAVAFFKISTSICERFSSDDSLLISRSLLSSNLVFN
jgi:hypothetical protein